MAFRSKTFRLKYLIDRAFQGRILSRICLYWCMYHAIQFMAMFLYQYMEYRTQVITGAISPVAFESLFVDFCKHNVMLIVVAGLAFPLLLWDVLKLTHRVSGPVHRINQVFQAINSGQPAEEITLRKGDYLTELRDTLNQHIEQYNALLANEIETPDAEPLPMVDPAPSNENELDSLLNSIETSYQTNNPKSSGTSALEDEDEADRNDDENTLVLTEVPTEIE